MRIITQVHLGLLHREAVLPKQAIQTTEIISKTIKCCSFEHKSWHTEFSLAINHYHRKLQWQFKESVPINKVAHKHLTNHHTEDQDLFLLEVALQIRRHHLPNLYLPWEDLDQDIPWVLEARWLLVSQEDLLRPEQAQPPVHQGLNQTESHLLPNLWELIRSLFSKKEKIAWLQESHTE